MRTLSCSTCTQTWPERTASAAMRSATLIVCPHVADNAAFRQCGDVASYKQQVTPQPRLAHALASLLPDGKGTVVVHA